VTGTVAWIHVAPIKALAVQELRRVHVGLAGVAEDRRFCIVDAEDRMVNAKRVNELVAVRPEFAEDMRYLTLHLPDGSRVSAEIAYGTLVSVSIYRRHEPARVVDGPFAEALSRIAGQPVRLVRFDDAGEGVDRSEKGGAVSLLAAASLDALAAAAAADGPVDPRRFRMLFGVAGVPAHAEDGWVGERVAIGDAVVVPEGNIGRCVVTSVGPESGRSDLDTLGALARYRGAHRTTEKLPFGVWARVERAGVVRVGDPITV
jgi:uncharacterized protein YcbX